MSDEVSLAELIKRVDESFAKANEQLDALSGQRNALSEQIERLNAIIKSKQEIAKAWEEVRSLLSKRIQDQSESFPTGFSVNQTESPQKPPTPTSIVVSESEDPAYGTKSAVARRILTEADAGITPKELTEKMEKLGHSVSQTFASSTLYRLKGSGEVTEKDGRYFWVGKPRYTLEVKQLDPTEAGSKD